MSPAPRCPVLTRLYRDGRVVAEGFPAAELGDRLAAEPDAYAWLDLHDPDEADLQGVVQEFGLHPLAVEDALNAHQRPKIDRYDSSLFLQVYAVDYDPRAMAASATGLSAFVTARALVTVRPGSFEVAALTARWDSAPELATSGVGYLVHGLLDLVVDSQYEAVQRVDDALDDLQDALFEPHASDELRRRGFALRRATVLLRRAVEPMTEVLDRLLRGPSHLAEGQLEPYFSDVRDHVLHAVEGLAGAGELLTGVLNTSLAEQGNDLNVVTRKLAAWAAIIAVPTAVTGFYGQNVPYPGFSHHWGFWTSSAVIVALSLGLYVQLKRRGWL